MTLSEPIGILNTCVHVLNSVNLFTEYSKQMFFLAFYTQTPAHARTQPFASIHTSQSIRISNLLIHVPNKSWVNFRENETSGKYRTSLWVCDGLKEAQQRPAVHEYTQLSNSESSFFALSNGHNHSLLSHGLSLYHMRCFTTCLPECAWVSGICCCPR